jgi:hypothetical protein
MSIATTLPQRSPGMILFSITYFLDWRSFAAFTSAFCKIVHVPIHHERGHRVIQRLFEGCGSSYAMDTTRHQLILPEGIHRPLLVGVKL